MLNVFVFFLFFNIQKLIHELGHYLIAQRLGVNVREFGIGYRPRMLKLGNIKETMVTLNWLPIGSFIKMTDDTEDVQENFRAQSKRNRIGILAIGPIITLITCLVYVLPSVAIHTQSFLSGVPTPITGVNMVGEEATIAKMVIRSIGEGSPADTSGLELGDIIVGGDNIEFQYTGDVTAYIEQNRGQEIILHIDRNGQRIEIPVVPRENPPQGQGLVGFGFYYEREMEIVSLPPLRALSKGIDTTVWYFWKTITYPIDLIQHQIPFSQVISGSNEAMSYQIGLVYDEVTTDDQYNQTYALLGMLSIVLTSPLIFVSLISLMPIPGWDIWRILLIIFEKKNAS